jgi:hypothetical protein
MEGSAFELRFAGTRDEVARWVQFLDPREMLLVFSAPPKAREQLWEMSTRLSLADLRRDLPYEPLARTAGKPGIERETFIAWLAETILHEAYEGPAADAWRLDEAQARRNAYERARFLNDYELLGGDALVGARGKSNLSWEWRRHGDVFALSWQGQAFFPSFQFTESEPKPVIRDIVIPFRERGASEWEIALWLAAPNAWLRQRPAQLLDEDPGAVAVAARRAFEVLG